MNGDFTVLRLPSCPRETRSSRKVEHPYFSLARRNFIHLHYSLASRILRAVALSAGRKVIRTGSLTLAHPVE
jgi:hypothetical protein